MLVVHTVEMRVQEVRIHKVRVHEVRVHEMRVQSILYPVIQCSWSVSVPVKH